MFVQRPMRLGLLLTLVLLDCDWVTVRNANWTKNIFPDANASGSLN